MFLKNLTIGSATDVPRYCRVSKTTVNLQEPQNYSDWSCLPKIDKGSKETVFSSALLQTDISVMFGLEGVLPALPLRDLMKLLEKSRGLVLRSVSY